MSERPGKDEPVGGIWGTNGFTPASDTAGPASPSCEDSVTPAAVGSGTEVGESDGRGTVLAGTSDCAGDAAGRRSATMPSAQSGDGFGKLGLLIDSPE